MQKIMNVALTFGILANLAFTGYLYTQFEQGSRDLQSMLNAPFKAPGKGLDAYDMSTPESSLRSFKAAIDAFDLQAGIDLFKVNARSDNSPYLEYLLGEDAELEVVKTHLIKNTSSSDSAGKVLAFIRVTASGVESRDVQAFEKKDGLYLPASYYLSGYSKEDWTDEDKFLDKVQKSWKTTGKL